MGVHPPGGEGSTNLQKLFGWVTQKIMGCWVWASPFPAVVSGGGGGGGAKGGGGGRYPRGGPRVFFPSPPLFSSPGAFGFLRPPPSPRKRRGRRRGGLGLVRGGVWPGLRGGGKLKTGVGGAGPPPVWLRPKFLLGGGATPHPRGVFFGGGGGRAGGGGGGGFFTLLFLGSLAEKTRGGGVLEGGAAHRRGRRALSFFGPGGTGGFLGFLGFRCWCSFSPPREEGGRYLKAYGGTRMAGSRGWSQRSPRACRLDPVPAGVWKRSERGLELRA